MLIRSFRRFLRLKPPYYEARQKLYEAIASNILTEDNPLEPRVSLIEKTCGWDSLIEGADWVELQAWSEKLGLKVNTIGDFIRLLEAIDSQYEA